MDDNFTILNLESRISKLEQEVELLKQKQDLSTKNLVNNNYVKQVNDTRVSGRPNQVSGTIAVDRQNHTNANKTNGSLNQSIKGNVAASKAVVEQRNVGAAEASIPASGRVNNSYRAQTVNNSNNYHATKNKDIEAFLGKHGMALGASCLIFIAMIMFAKLIIPILGDAFKVAVMYIFSGAFIVSGELLARKKGETKWTTSLVGCGVGAIFISSYVTHIVFHFIGVNTLFVFLILWAGYLCYLSRKKSIIFSIIGQCGILISVLFSLGQINGDAINFIIVMTMILLSEAPYLISDLYSKKYWNFFVTWCGTTLSFLIMIAGSFSGLFVINWVAVLLSIIGTILVIYSSLVQATVVEKRSHYIIYNFQLISTLWIFAI